MDTVGSSYKSLTLFWRFCQISNLQLNKLRLCLEMLSVKLVYKMLWYWQSSVKFSF